MFLKLYYLFGNQCCYFFAKKSLFILIEFHCFFEKKTMSIFIFEPNSIKIIQTRKNTVSESQKECFEKVLTHIKFRSFSYEKAFSLHFLYFSFGNKLNIFTYFKTTTCLFVIRSASPVSRARPIIPVRNSDASESFCKQIKFFNVVVLRILEVLNITFKSSNVFRISSNAFANIPGLSSISLKISLYFPICVVFGNNSQ